MADNDTTKFCTDCKMGLEHSMFNKSGQGQRLRPQCKPCQKAREKAQMAQRRSPDAERPPAKTCSACGVTKPFDSSHFKTRNASKWGLTTECKTCLCAREAQRNKTNGKAKETRKRWKQNNLDLVRAYARKAMKIRAAKLLVYMRSYREKNKKALAHAAHANYLDKRDEIRARHAQWRVENPLKTRSYTAAYKARKMGAEGSFTGHDIKKLFEVQRGSCAACGAKLNSYHVDHIDPISKGGSNDKNNLQLLCRTCNLRKSNSHPIDFMQLMGRLL